MDFKGMASAVGGALGNTDWASLAETVAGAGAPILGSILGGVVGGPAGAALGSSAGKMIANALGVSPTPDAVANAIATDPAAVEKIKQLEMEHSDDLQEVVAEMQDTQSARTMETSLVQSQSPISFVPPILSFVIIVGFFGNVGVLYFLPKDVPPNVLQLLNISFGTFSAAFVQVLNYWFGTSRSSERNGETMRAIAGAASGTPIPPDPSAKSTTHTKRGFKLPHLS